MHIVRISPWYFVNWLTLAVSEAIYISGWQLSSASVCVLSAYWPPPLTSLITQDPVPPPAPHSNRLSYISLPGDRCSSSSGRGPGHLREAHHQGRGRAARPSSTHEMLSSGPRSSSQQARLQPVVRWGTSDKHLLAATLRPDTQSLNIEYQWQFPVLNHRIESQFGTWLIFCSHENKENSHQWQAQNDTILSFRLVIPVKSYGGFVGCPLDFTDFRKVL